MIPMLQPPRRGACALFPTLVFLAAAVPFASAAPPLESWVDPSLPAVDGLELWWDSTTLPAASRARGEPPPQPGSAVTRWFDGSGWNRDLTAEAPQAPLFKSDHPDTPALRFDGVDDRMELRDLALDFKEVTVFIVAAPRSNKGGFLAFLAFNRAGQNDYTSGLTVDMSSGASRRFETLNPEGVGFGGARDLMEAQFPFGTFHVLSVVTGIGPARTGLFVDGKAEGQRERADSRLRADHILVGARRYSHTPEPPFPRGFLDGDIAEVLLYNHALSEPDRRKIEAYLMEKHAALRTLAGISREPGATELVPVENPPPVQMLVPGFEVRQLPVSLNNLTGLGYRSDGKLVALGYDSRIYLLSDGDGDGLEETVEIFWDRGGFQSPIGMALTPRGYERGNGVFVPSKGKLSLIVDTNADDRADQEIVVADGWQPLAHSVDAMGVAVDREGSIYFSLGTEEYFNAYLIDPATGQSRYTLGSVRGTVQKVSPDFSRMETVCTGVRFLVGMAFNAVGDLFATDQEGATWLANGNPFDELLHIQPGRHYGFPPRHPRYLPDAIDEPSVFDYQPQHQSTCGLAFNAPVNQGPVFGPSRWRDDAFVAGYSRGKLYRTELCKTDAGYVAQNRLLACLNQLTVDSTVSPQGDLVIAVHSGQPDWGTGPNGPGTLYKVRYAHRELPQPVVIHPLSPTQTRIAFDRPIDPEQFSAHRARGNAPKEATTPSMSRGRYVSAGDRFESFQPGYQVVNDQSNTPRFDVPILATQISADRRDLILISEPRRQALGYAVTLPGLGRPGAGVPAGVLPQHPDLDLAYQLHGVEAEWRSSTDNAAWSGWLPHLDLAVARQFTRGSAEHDRLWRQLTSKGTLTLRGQLDLGQMLRPVVQPGSTLDYSWPDETVLLTLVSDGNLTLRLGEQTHRGRERLVVTAPAGHDWLPFEVSATDSDSPGRLQLSWHTQEDPRERALPVRRLMPPWALSEPEPPATGPREVPELAGGDWLKGRQLFLSDRAGCYKCHQMQGQGGTIGPDLSNLIHRDYASVLKDIREPSAAINPDHLAFNVDLRDGDTLSGVIQENSSERVVLGSALGERVVIPRANIEAIRPSSLSIMPEGLDQGLTATELRDLLTYLLISPLAPAPVVADAEPPPPRTRTEIAALMDATPPPGGAQAAFRPLHVVLAAGPKDHGPGEHDYPLWQERWAKLLALAEGLTVSTAMDWPSAELFRTADVIVCYSHNPGWSAARARELDAFLERGGGLVYLHYAVDGLNAVDEFSQRIGLAWRGGQSKFRHGPLELALRPHPITRGMATLKLVDESYWDLTGNVADVEILGTGIEEGEPKPLLWTKTSGNGRVFVSIPGHYTWTFDDPLFRILILRAVAWTAGEPVDRLVPLATIGAR